MPLLAHVPCGPARTLQALLALGRPEAALAVDRGVVGSTGGGAAAGGDGASESLERAQTRMEIRLRCGLAGVPHHSQQRVQHVVQRRGRVRAADVEALHVGGWAGGPVGQRVSGSEGCAWLQATGTGGSY